MTGTEFRRLRAQGGWTQAELAQRLRVVRATVVRWENGHSRIPAATAELMRLVADPPRRRRNRR